MWDSQRLLCHRKCSVNWTTKKTSGLWLWISRPHPPTSAPGSSVSSVPVPSVSSLPAILRVQCSGAIGFQFTSHPPCPVFRCHRFPVYQPPSVSSVPVPSVSSLPATLRVQCSGAIGFQFTSHPPCPVFRRHRFPWMPILWILRSQKAPTLRKWRTCLWQLSLNKLFMSTTKRCRAFAYSSCVSGRANGEKKSGGL